MNIKIAGFVKRIRRHSQVLFLDILEYNQVDRIFKIVAKTPYREKLEGVNIDSYLELLTEKERDKDSYIVTGISRLSRNNTFLNAESCLFGDNARNYRYMYLRNIDSRRVLDIRSRVLLNTRIIMTRKNLHEFQTPILTVPSREGARDFLVSSRLHKGKYYALAQSPQIYKQALIYSGYDYYQISPSFRDEDSRSDRANGEFYQVDVELRSKDLNEIVDIAREYILTLFDKLGVELILLEDMSFYESQDKYGTDKPLFNKADVLSWNGNISHNIEGFYVNCTAENIPESTRPRCIGCILKNGPMIEIKNGKKDFAANPFIDYREDGNRIIAENFDVVVEGYELASGGMRNICPESMISIMKTCGVKHESYDFILKAMRAGIPRHGGFAFGLERLTAIIASKILNRVVTVDETIPFPWTDKKIDGFTRAPVDINDF